MSAGTTRALLRTATEADGEGPLDISEPEAEPPHLEIVANVLPEPVVEPASTESPYYLADTVRDFHCPNPSCMTSATKSSPPGKNIVAHNTGIHRVTRARARECIRCKTITEY